MLCTVHPYSLPDWSATSWFTLRNNVTYSLSLSPSQKMWKAMATLYQVYSGSDSDKERTSLQKLEFFFLNLILRILHATISYTQISLPRHCTILIINIIITMNRINILQNDGSKIYDYWFSCSTATWLNAQKYISAHNWHERFKIYSTFRST